MTGRSHRVGVANWKIDRDFHADRCTIADAGRTAVQLDDALDDGESEPDAASRRLGREERVENLADRLDVDAVARVGDAHHDATRTAAIAQFGVNVQGTTLAHGLERVQADVDD